MTEMTRRFTSHPNVRRTSKAEDISAVQQLKFLSERAKMAFVYKIILYTGVFAVVFQLLCLLLAWSILNVVGAFTLSLMTGFVLMWLINYHMPRKIIYCKDKAVLITGNCQMS